MNLRRSLTIFLSGLLFSAAASAATFTVTSQSDSGAGSLRQAISDAAASAGKDTIAFNVAAAQPEITLLTPLPGLNGDTLDGFTQPGGTRVKLRWNFYTRFFEGLLPAEGEGAVIQGLDFQSDFPIAPPPEPGTWSAIYLRGAGSHQVKACRFTGRQAGIVIFSPNNIIGGGTGMRNEFTVYIGIMIRGTAASPATGNVIRGNKFLGPEDVSMLQFAPHSTLYALDFSANTRIESDASTGAVNTFDGLFNILYAENSANLIFRGNRAGDTAPNATVLGSSNNGLIGLSNCSGSIVENNSLLQSGNHVITLSGCPGSRVRGNTIRNTADTHVTNLNTGITVYSSIGTHISGNVIGGMEEGIRLESSGAALTAIRVDGNFIGLSQAYTPASETPVASDPSILHPCDAGIVVVGNVASLNETARVEIGGVADAGTGHLGPNTVIANFAGIALMPPSGGQTPFPRNLRLDRNRIALMRSIVPGPPGSNSVAGQWIMLASTHTSVIYSAGYAIPANDPDDSDVGSNGIMNYPTLAVSATEATGTLDTKPNTACTIQINACPTDGTVLTGIPVFIGAANVVTDGSGHASYTIPLASPPPSGSLCYAMATDNEGNTSHIGSKVSIGLPIVSLAFPTPEVRAVEGTPFPVTITRSGDLSIASTVSILVSAGDAEAPAINGDTSDVGIPTPVTFQPGESSKEVLIPIIDDDLTEPAEKVRLTLQVAGGADLGAVATGLITITHSDLPRVTLGNATLAEGNAASPVGHVVTLPFTVDRPVMGAAFPDLRFRIVGGTATLNVDYRLAGAFEQEFIHAQFSAGAGGDVLRIALLDDTVYEPDETIIIEYDHAIQTYPDGSPIIDDTVHSRGTLTIQNDDQAAVRIVPLEVTVSEGDSGTTMANLSVQLAEGPIDVEVRVPWQTVNGTAIAGSDYTATSGEVILAPGTASQTISIPIIGDTLVDRWPAVDESFTVQLGTPVNAVAAPGQSSAAVSIKDDDSRSISLNDASLTEGNSGTAVMTFTATIPTPTGSPVSFEWNTAADTADSSDFTGLSGTLTIPAGETEASISIEIKGDALYENNETFSIIAGAATNGTLTRQSATGTILNDDTAPSMTVTNTVVTEGTEDVDFFAWFQVRLSAASGAPVTFQWSTAAGTATAGVDYIESSNTSVIPPGDRNFWIAVPVLGDSVSDSDETFDLHIPGASGAIVPTAGLTGTCTLKETTITSFFPVPGVPGLYALTFWTGRGQSYLIEQSASLGEDQEWIPVSGVIPGSSAEITQLQFSLSPSAYFRVRATATPPN